MFDSNSLPIRILINNKYQNIISLIKLCKGFTNIHVISAIFAVVYTFEKPETMTQESS